MSILNRIFSLFAPLLEPEKPLPMLDQVYLTTIYKSRCWICEKYNEILRLSWSAKTKTYQNTLEFRNTTRWLYQTTEDDLIILKNVSLVFKYIWYATNYNRITSSQRIHTIMS